jgi:hypothetical protein
MKYGIQERSVSICWWNVNNPSMTATRGLVKEDKGGREGMVGKEEETTEWAVNTTLHHDGKILTNRNI